MKALIASLKRNPEVVVQKCVGIVGKTGTGRRDLAFIAGILVEALTDSISAGNAELFYSSMNACRKLGSAAEDPSLLPGIISVLEGVTMEAHLSGENTRFLWSLFGKARTMIIESQWDSERKFRDLAALMPQVIFEIDAQGTVLFVNKQAYDFFGYRESDFTGPFNCFDHIDPADFPRMMANLKKVAEGGRSRGNEYSGVKKDGTRFPILIYLVRVLDDGRLAGYRGIIIDITERKKIEEDLQGARQKLEESQKVYRTFLDSTTDLIFLKDENLRYLLANRAYCDHFGKKEEEVLGTTDPTFMSLDVASLCRSSDMRALERDDVTTGIARLDDRIYEVMRFPVEIASGRTGVGGLVRDVTERVEAEEALRKSEENLRRFFEVPLMGVVRLSPDGEWLEVNHAFCDMIGYSREELLGMRWQDITPPEKVAKENELYRMVLEDDSQSVATVEARCLSKNGGLVDVIVSAHCVRKEDGTPDHLMCVLQDISASKRAERKIIESERELRAIISASPIGIGRIRNRVIEWVNEAMCAMTGYDVENLTGRKNRFLYESDAEFERIGTVLYRDGQAETKWVKKDGEIIDILLQVSPADNNAFIYTATDITRLKAARAALSMSEARLRAVIDSAKDTIFIKNQGRRYIVANRAMSELFGLPAEEVVGATDADIFPPEAARLIAETDVRVLRGETVEEEMERPIGEKRRIFHTIKVPLKNDRGEITGICGIARDVTERKHLETRLQQSQKMEAVGTLAGGVAHDFNNLLSAIMGYASLLQIKLGKDNPLYTYASNIMSSSEKAASLTRNLLAFSRKQVINLKPILINETIEKLHRLLERLIPEDVLFTLDICTEKLIVMADPGQLDQVVMNLATNARDAMPRGGRLTITVDRAAIDSGLVTADGYARPGDYARIVIADSGIGIDKATTEKIFEPFFTTKEVGKGTGLGLAIVYGIINQHQGHIAVNSQPGKGSTFSVYLPLVRMEPADRRHDEGIRGGTETVLIAEDNAELRELSAQVLSDHGYTVHAAADGRAAVRTFRKYRGAITLAVLDVVMPKMNGKETFDAIRKIDPSVKVIFTSGYTDDIIEEKGLVNKEYDFLGKPITPATLLLKIREVLDRE